MCAGRSSHETWGIAGRSDEALDHIETWARSVPALPGEDLLAAGWGTSDQRIRIGAHPFRVQPLLPADGRQAGMRRSPVGHAYRLVVQHVGRFLVRQRRPDEAGAGIAAITDLLRATLEGALDACRMQPGPGAADDPLAEGPRDEVLEQANVR